MTADKALAWVAEHNAFVDRDPTRGDAGLWSVSVQEPRLWSSRMGSTLVHAVTRLKAKLEAER